MDTATHSMPAMPVTDVPRRIESLRTDARLHRKAHLAATLVKEDDLRAVLVVVEGGTQLHPHQPDESVVLQVLDGLLRVHLPGETVTAAAGAMLTLAGGVLHHVEAVRDSAFLLLLPWPVMHAPSAANDTQALRESEIDETVQQSMPASDPPSWTQTHAGTPRRDTPADTRSGR